MATTGRTRSSASTLDDAAQADVEALQHLQQAIAQGSHWFVALLETIALWRSQEEEYDGRSYRYLLGGEAFDWLLLAERLCEELKGTVPQSEVEALLVHGQFPVELSPWEFQRLIGRAKYRAYLNFWYGVLVEEALLLVVEERLAKERHSIGYAHGYHDGNAVYQWVYGSSLEDLLLEFQCERGLAPTQELTLSEFQEFTYWCFKYRLSHRDPAKVASDTRLGLERLRRMHFEQGQRRHAVAGSLFPGWT